MPGRKDRDVFARMALGRADVANAAVPVIVVVPMHELARPLAPGAQIREASSRSPRRRVRRRDVDAGRKLTTRRVPPGTWTIAVGEGDPAGERLTAPDPRFSIALLWHGRAAGAITRLQSMLGARWQNFP